MSEREYKTSFVEIVGEIGQGYIRDQRQFDDESELAEF